MLKPSLKIQDLCITPPLALAPMVGLSHSALRSLILEIGGVGILFTEMLSAKTLPEENHRISPFLVRSEEEQPLFYQIFLHQPDALIPAIKKLHTLNAQGIDLNAGCPAPSLKRQGAGCALSRNPVMLQEILKTMRSNSALPISVKIRLGDRMDKEKLIELCKIIEGEGVDCLTIHARLNNEKFCRKPRWDWVGIAKKELSIPVIANGGIFTVEDAKICLDNSGADGLMIGRGAACRPWLFAEIAEAVYGVPQQRNVNSSSEIFFRFFELLENRFVENRRLGRLKQFTHYFASPFLYGHGFASRIQNSKSMDMAKEIAEDFFASSEDISM